MIPPALFIFCKIAESAQGLFLIQYKFLEYLFWFLKYTIGILIGIALNVQIALGRRAILVMLLPPIHEHGMCFHLFVSSSISFFSGL